MRHVEAAVSDKRLARQPNSIAAMAARLKLTRTGLGLTQAELCRKADLSRNTYNQWERGHGRPDVHYAMRLCEAFGITLDWIFRGETKGLPRDLADLVLRAGRGEARLSSAADPVAAAGSA